MFDTDILTEYASDGRIKRSSRDGYSVWCYTQNTVYSRYWDEVTMACRGLVTRDSDGGLVSRPIRKFFNVGEPEALVRHDRFFAYDEVDGSLIVVGRDNGQAVVSTKGSFDTWHSEAARGLLSGFVPPKGVTAVFELIHPDNRIVLDYQGYEGLYLIAAIDNVTGADIGTSEEVADFMGWHGDVVARRSFDLQRMMETVKDPLNGEGREGFVIVWPNDNGPWDRIKLKFAQYVLLHGIYTGLTNRKVWEVLQDDSWTDWDALLEIAPDELHGAIKSCARELADQANRLCAQAETLVTAVSLMPTRKEQAEYILANSTRPVSGLAFAALDDKDVHKLALQQVRPAESRNLAGTFKDDE